MSEQTFPSPVYLGRQLHTACPGGEGQGSFHRYILLPLTLEFHTINGDVHRFYINDIYFTVVTVILHFSTLGPLTLVLGSPTYSIFATKIL